jgi:hypothetical protein
MLASASEYAEYAADSAFAKGCMKASAYNECRGNGAEGTFS